ncbi:MAG: pH signal transduction [Lasallia pustulata]|uniref:pH signal transduction n=1 Tax=Lasallia pustulata TaxID=136370 RepID=A0A5M8PH80_9LECA|nr:MAG: pH signal transduction [Lasallia pustulata]
MPPDHKLHGRQIWATPTSTSSAVPLHCTPFTLPSRGLLTIDSTSIITLTENAIFHPECTGEVSIHPGQGSPAFIDLRDPFYASTSPQIYAIASSTVLSYMLVIMLLITPRTFFVGGASGGIDFLGRRGMISGASGSTSVIGVGRRPWLQKVAALTVAVSLTIATADTFKVAERQYNVGYQDASALTDEVVGGLEIRVVRVISDTCLWLAQVQTLIRLFPRHKEKVIIKWTGFALIVLDTIFSILDNFMNNAGRTRPRTFVDAIPALSYLFALALSLLYAAWVIYYSLSKRRYAFFHPKMRNICLVAILSLTAVLIPVVFFVLDISKPNVAGWGDYVRWVGAAAASVVVWEWVERIEALERDERKDGILGREIFDGDEMLEVTPSEEINSPRGRCGPGAGGGARRDGDFTTTGWGGMTNETSQVSRSRLPPQQGHQNRAEARDRRCEIAAIAAVRSSTALHGNPTPPPAVASPVSRADTTSAASTVYAVHYHPVSEPTPSVGIPMNPGTEEQIRRYQAPQSSLHVPRSQLSHQTDKNLSRAPVEVEAIAPQVQSASRWQNVTKPFKRRRASPPPEVSNAASRAAEPRPSGNIQREPRPGSYSLGRLRGMKRPRAPDVPLPVMVIPAQPRGRVWSPAMSEDADAIAASVADGPNDNSFENGDGAKGKATERHGLSIDSAQRSTANPYLTPDISGISSSTNSTNAVLSQRGHLTIYEAGPQRSPTQLPRQSSDSSLNEVSEPSQFEDRQSVTGREFGSARKSYSEGPGRVSNNVTMIRGRSSLDEEHSHGVRPPEG